MTRLTRRSRLFRSLFPLALFSSALFAVAQTPAPGPVPAAATPAENDGTVSLSAFEVQSSASTGYGAQYSSSSSRLNLRYIDVPQTVSVVTAEFLKDSYIFDSHDFVQYVNNVYPRANTHQSETFFIRGLQVTNTYLDGFISPLTVNRDAALYDRIEYVKGPASAAMGRGEAGGLVNFVSKRPLKTKRTRFNTIVGTDNFYRAELDHNGIVTKDGRLSYRIATYYEDGDGTRGGDLMHIKKSGIGPSLLWDYSAKTQISLTGAFFKYNGPGNVGETYWSNYDVYRFQRELKQIPDANVASNWNPLAGDPFVPEDRIFGFAGKGRENEVAEISLIVSHKFTDELSYRQGFSYGNFDEEYRRFSLAVVATRNPADPKDFLLGHTFLHQFQTREAGRAQGDLLFEKTLGSTSHQLLAGYDAYRNSNRNRQGQRGGLSQSLYNPSYVLPSFFDPETYIVDYTTNSKSEGQGFGYYGQYSGWFFEKKINVMYGWRKDRSQSRSTNFRNNTRGSSKEVTSVPRYSITYKPVDAVSIYYVHSEQADPIVTANTYSNFSASAGATVPPASDPRYNERLTSQVKAQMDDFGVKANVLDQKVTVSASIFKIKRSGFILNDFVAEVGANGVGIVNFNRNYIVSGENVHGFEIEVFGQPTRQLTFTAGYAAQSGSKPASTGLIVPIESLIDSATFTGKYSFRNQQNNGFEVTFGGKYWFKGWVMSPGATSTFSSDQYKYDLGASYYWKNGRYSVSARVNNVGDDLVYMSQNSQWALRRSYLSFSGSF